MQPIVGLSGRRAAGSILGTPRGFADTPLDVYMSEYAIAVVRAGGLPFHLSPDADPVAIVERLDGLLLSGGDDVDSRRYGQAPIDRKSVV